jgi:predicted ATP-grasp superfamily ATP-dependent carboligase
LFLAEHGGPLREAFVFPRVAAGLPRVLAGKDTMPAAVSAVCGGLGLAAPVMAVPASVGQAEEFAAGTGFPVVAKLASPWVPAGLRSTSLLADGGELEAAVAACAGAGARLLLQEFVPWSPGGDWFFHGYRPAGGPMVASFTGVKDRSYPARAGLTSYGRWVVNTPLAAAVAALAARLGFAGICDLDLRFDPRDGLFKLLDFNPRLGAQFRLFTDTAGVDVARAAYLDLTGQPVPAGNPLPGRAFAAENYDPLAAVSYWRAGDLTPRGWLASLRRADELAWWARDDHAPFAAMCLRMGWRAATRPLPAARRPRAAAGAGGAAPRCLPGRAAAPPRDPAPPVTAAAAAAARGPAAGEPAALHGGPPGRADRRVYRTEGERSHEQR